MSASEAGAPKVWLITGTTRGLGLALTRAALADGHKVIATGRNAAVIERALGSSPAMLPVTFDVTRAGDAEATVKAGLERFGTIDVLVNNAGYALFGALEECSAAELERQFAVNVFGLVAATKAVLPIFRRQRRGHIFNLSSMAGISAGPGSSSYSATKFAVEGFSEGLSHELGPLGIKVTIVEPGFFRTDFLEPSSAAYAARRIADYDETAGATRRRTESMNGRQAGDPEKLARAILALADATEPPLRFLAGADALDRQEQAIRRRKEEASHWRDLSTSLAYGSGV